MGNCCNKGDYITTNVLRGVCVDGVLASRPDFCGCGREKKGDGGYCRHDCCCHDCCDCGCNDCCTHHDHDCGCCPPPPQPRPKPDPEGCPKAARVEPLGPCAGICEIIETVNSLIENLIEAGLMR